MFSFLLALVTALVTPFLLETFMQPKPRSIWQRSLSDHAIHIGLLLLLYLFEFLLFQRPWFAAVNVIAWYAVLVLVNHAKFESLREPFLFQDFEYFVDAIKHPRLYLPFLGWGRGLLAIGGFVGIIMLGLKLESSVLPNSSLSEFLIISIALAILSCIFLLIGRQASQQRLKSLSFLPSDDVWRTGLLAFFWDYAWAEKKHPFPNINTFANVNQNHDARPDILVVQSESFFDARVLSPAIKRDVLNHFDKISEEALTSGKLFVPAWGANTVRTEFGFLSGMSQNQLGIHQFNPYRSIANRPESSLTTLAHYYQKRGYRTVCLHPYPASFYRREQVYERLGFDEFIDIKAFANQEEGGPYISDEHLTDKLLDLLRRHRTDSQQPLFVFTITMENHGPLHLEQISPAEIKSFYDGAPPMQGAHDLSVYLKHLKNANQMIRRIKQALEQAAKPSLFVWYGDHVPILPKTYKMQDKPPSATDFFIWSTEKRGGITNYKTYSINQLGQILLEAC